MDGKSDAHTGAHRSSSRTPLRHGSIPFALLAVVLGAGLTNPLHSQQRDTTVVVGQRYARSGLHRWIFGSEYRELWTAAIRAPILDLATFGGGLTPTTACPGSPFCPGLQTLSLRFDGADGRKYGFRAIDKVQNVLGEEFQGTIVQDIAQDATSAAHPAGPAIAAVLMEAAGIPHTNPALVVLPDGPELGEHRELFAGAVGFIEARAVVEPGVPPFANADEMIGDEDIFVKLRESNRNRVATEAFLKARLFDMLIGDWDRHRGQWGWVRFGDAPVTEWVPVPEDRDQAFVRYDGLAYSIARWTTPQLVNFTTKQPSVLGVNWNGREVDRHFLPDLSRSVWDSIASLLQEAITDDVIDAAVRAMPDEYYALNGNDLSATLRARRDWLGEFAGRYYLALARQPDIHASDETERVTITRNIDGSSRVVLARSDGSAFFDRVFTSQETDEIRIYLYGGADSVTVDGQGAATIEIRIIAGEGDDIIVNTSGAGGIRIYDAAGRSTVTEGQVDLNDKPYVEPPRPPGNSPPHRDWGELWRFLLWGSYSPDLGLFLGGGATRTSYGFRQVPFATQLRMRGGWAFKHNRGNLDIRNTWHQPNARHRYELQTRVSGVEITRFHGLGNEVAATGSSQFYRVNQVQLRIAPDMVVPVTPRLQIAFGADMEYTNTRDDPGTFLTDSLPDLYGDDKFGQLGASARIVYDSRNITGNPTSGLRFEVSGRFRPKVWSVDSTAYGDIRGTASTYLAATGTPLRPTLAFRAGAKKVFGTFPFMSAAFIGDAETVRLGRENRYGGEAAAWGNVELRLHLGSVFIVLPQEIGVFGLFDVGRVWLEGEVSDKWHTAYGGGVWIAPIFEANTISIAWAQSAERGGLYIQSGFAF